MNREIFLHVGLKGLRQSGMLLLLAVVVALIGNQVRPQGLALVDEEWSLEAHIKAPDGSGMTVTLDEAKEFFFSGSAVFIDARSEDLYRFGHILGARGVPWEQVESTIDKATGDLAPDTLLITYCDGEGCGLSWELALELINRGFMNVRVLVNGWSLWKEADLPVEAGPPVPGS